MTNRRAVAIACFASFIAMGVISSVLGPTLRNIAASLALPIEDAGILRTVQQIGGIAATLGGGYLLNRRSPQAVLIPGMILIAVGMPLAIATSNLPVSLAALLMAGIGTGFINLGANVAIASLFEANAASVLAALHTFYGVGLFSGPLIVEQVLRQPENWRTAYIIPAVAGVVLAIALVLLPVEKPERVRLVSPGQAPTQHAILWLPLLPLILLLFMYNGAGTGIGDWISTHLQLVAHATPDIGAQVTSLYGLALMTGRAISIVLLRRLGNMRTMAAAITISVVGSALILIGGPQIGLVTVGVAMVGFGFSPVYSTVIAIAGQQQPDNRGAVTGIVAGLASIGGMIFPVIQGKIGAGQNGGMIVIFVSAVIMLFSLVLIRVTSNRSKQRPIEVVEGRSGSA